jgi:hypothetical protein
MPQSRATISTTMAGRYMNQLCKHFAHKLPATLGEREGRIEFASGVCTLAVEGDLLVLDAAAPDEAMLDRLQEVVARHLERFAFRDKPEVRWGRVGLLEPPAQ